MATNNPQISLAHEYELKPLIYFTGFVILIVAIALVLTLRDSRQEHSVPTRIATPFPEVALEAKAAYVYDLATSMTLFAKDEDKKLPLASLAKVMSALVARDLGLKHNTVKISDEALAVEGDSGLLRDEEWFLGDLLNFSLVASSNDGVRAAALALGALSRANASGEEIVGDFVKIMNEKAAKLGLTNIQFFNETGLDLSDVRNGAYGSAQDVTSLMAYIHRNYPDILSVTREPEIEFKSLDGKTHVAKNTNEIISHIPGLLASKTGYTARAGGNLSIIFDPELNHPIAITVLGSTENGRFSDVRALVAATLEHLNK